MGAGGEGKGRRAGGEGRRWELKGRVGDGSYAVLRLSFEA